VVDLDWTIGDTKKSHAIVGICMMFRAFKHARASRLTIHHVVQHATRHNGQGDDDRGGMWTAPEALDGTPDPLTH
jgi:hypothetical protein